MPRIHVRTFSGAKAAVAAPSPMARTNDTARIIPRECRLYQLLYIKRRSPLIVRCVRVMYRRTQNGDRYFKRYFATCPSGIHPELRKPSASSQPVLRPASGGPALSAQPGAVVRLLEAKGPTLGYPYRVSCPARAKFYSKKEFRGLQSHKRSHFPVITTILPRKI
jgi:hypothetical protein